MTIENILQQIDSAISYHQCHAIAKRTLELLDFGSSRCVFAINNEYVLKVAMNHSGVLQNGKEESISHVCQGIPLLSHIVESSSSKRAIITERVDFHHVNELMKVKYLISPLRFQNAMMDLSRYITFTQHLDGIEGGKSHLKDVQDEYCDVFSTMLGGFLLDLSLYENIILSDTGKKGGIGIKGRDIKIVDYGLTPKNFNTFHNPNNQMTDMESIIERLKFSEYEKQTCLDYETLINKLG